MALFSGTGLGQKTPAPLTAGQMFAGAAQGIGKGVIDPYMESQGFISAENQVIDIMKDVDINSVDSVSEAFNKIMVISPEAASEFRAQVLPLVTAKQNELASKAKGTTKDSDTKEVGYSYNGVTDPTKTMMVEKVNGVWKPIIDPSTKLPYSEDKFAGDTFEGKIPEGYRRIVAKDGSVSMEVVPGSPAEATLKADKAATAFKKQYQITNASLVLENIDDVFDLYNNRTTTTKIGPMDIGVDSIFSTAAKAYALTGVSQTPRANMDEAIAPIIANLGFDKLQAMRDASPTGGALGQVSNIELAALQKSLASLSLNQDAEQFEANLKKVQKHYRNMIKLMSAEGSEEIKDLQLDSKYEVTTGANGEAIVTLVEEKEPAF